MGAVWWWEEVDIAETPKGVPSAKLRLADGHGNMAPKNNAARLARTTANTVVLSTTSSRNTKGDARKGIAFCVVGRGRFELPKS